MALSKKSLLGNTVCSGEDPLSADERAAAEVLVQRVDEGHLPAPLPGGAVPASHHPAPSLRTLHAARVLVLHRVDQGRPLAGPLGLHGVRVKGEVRLLLDLFRVGVVWRPGWLAAVASVGLDAVATAQLLGLPRRRVPELVVAFNLLRGQMLLDLGAGGAADGATLLALEQLGSLRLAEATEGQVGGDAGSRAFGSWIRLLCCGCG